MVRSFWRRRSRPYKTWNLLICKWHDLQENPRNTFVFIHLSIYPSPFIHSLILPFIHHLFIHLSIHISMNLFMNPSIRSLIHICLDITISSLACRWEPSRFKSISLFTNPCSHLSFPSLHAFVHSFMLIHPFIHQHVRVLINFQTWFSSAIH